MYRSCCNCCCCCSNNQNNNIETACNNKFNVENNNSISGCGFNTDNIFPTNPMLAQSYVPIQFMNETFTPYCALKNGTIFPELATTYYPGQSMMDIDYLRMATQN